MEPFVKEIDRHLREKLIPFWEGLQDEKNGGFFGYMGYDRKVERHYEKGCILNSRILWFFSNAYLLYCEKEDGEQTEFLEGLRRCAEHAWKFLRERCMDREYGGVYWSVTWDGKPLDETKHTYNQAFAIYALSSFFQAFHNQEALALAFELQRIIQEKCSDASGYMEAFTRDFRPKSNEKLSENGVMAEKTMNTLLHVFEAYTELYRVTGDKRTGDYLRTMLDIFYEKVYNPALRRQEVFFDRNWHSLIDLHSYGHDIETAWLLDRGLEVLGDEEYTKRLSPVSRTLTEEIYRRAYRKHSLLNEAQEGVEDTTRVWWVQAEGVVGFLNGYQKQPSEGKYLEAAQNIWRYIQTVMVDKRSGSEWFWCVEEDGHPVEKPIVEPWKCPYHNGRMCMEVIRRMESCDLLKIGA